MWNNVSVKRGIIWCISVRAFYFICFNAQIQVHMGYKWVWVNVSMTCSNIRRKRNYLLLEEKALYISIYKEEIFLTLVRTTPEAIKKIWSKCRCTKGSPKVYNYFSAINVLVSSNLHFLIQMTCLLGSDLYELCRMDKNVFNDILIGKWKWIVCAINAYLFHDLCFVYVVETFITLNWKA